MKVAVFSESPADEAAIRMLVAGILGEPVESPAVLRSLHYHRDADGVVIVADSDRCVPHKRDHACPPPVNTGCRHRLLQAKAAEISGQLRARQGRGPVQTAVGLAVPAIEAWYLVGKESRVSGTEWMLGLQTRRPPYSTRDLKQMVYGTDRPSLELEARRASEAARRIVDEELLAALEDRFPGGFGAMADAVHNWQRLLGA